MQEQLYFITEICNSLRKGANAEEINNMVRDIIDKGKDKKYRQGYEQFLRFVEAGRAGWLAMPTQKKQIISQVVNEIIQESSNKIIPTSHKLSLLLERNGVTLATLKFSGEEQSLLIGDIYPGEYSLRTDSDWLLWQESLSETDLFWTHAYPDQDLPMAADTEGTMGKSIKKFGLLNGEIVFRIYPGLESGTMEIEVKNHVEK